MTYAEYKSLIRATLAEYGRQNVLVGPAPVKFLPAKGIAATEGGVIRGREPDIIFRDGARLQLYEKIHVINKEVLHLEYSYHYERPNGYFFRYEREDTDDPIRKPAYHMHVILDLPHFNAPPITLETVMQLIVVNFYSPKAYSKQIIGQEIHLTV